MTASEKNVKQHKKRVVAQQKEHIGDAPIRVDWLPLGDRVSGKLGLTFCPGKRGHGVSGFWNRNLDDDLAELLRLGVTQLAPLVVDSELRSLGVPDLPQRAQAAGLAVSRFPFHDGGIPESFQKLDAFLEQVSSNLQRGDHVAVHCRGGLGRAGVVGACMLLRLGLAKAPEIAIATVRRVRSRNAVETCAQERFISGYAAFLEQQGGHGRW